MPCARVNYRAESPLDDTHLALDVRLAPCVVCRARGRGRVFGRGRGRDRDRIATAAISGAARRRGARASALAELE